MQVDPGSSAAGSTVTGAIRQASQATGTSFNYLLATAQVESGLNPQAGASTSSARGLFQFIQQTWFATIKQHGAALGYGKYADAITQTSSGQYEVKDPALRTEILKLRNDPTANAVMAGAFTKANSDVLASKLGRQPSEGELYIAHFLGVGGAAKLISLADANPKATAANYFPSAAQANSSIFHNRLTGSARSLAQVRDILTARYDVARARPSDPSVSLTAQADISVPIPPNPIPAPASSTPPVAVAAATPIPAAAATAPVATSRTLRTIPIAAVASPAPDTAGITNAFAAAVPVAPAHDNQVFHGLFQDTDRTGPVAAVVSQLWGVPDSTPGASATPGGSILDLFRDPVKGS